MPNIHDEEYRPRPRGRPRVEAKQPRKKPLRIAREDARFQSGNAPRQNKDRTTLEEYCDYYVTSENIQEFDGFISSRAIHPVIFTSDGNTCLELSQLPMHMINSMVRRTLVENQLCTHCVRFYEDMDDLTRHKSALFETTNGNQCNKCGMQYHNWITFFRHHIAKHEIYELPYHCRNCVFLSTNRKWLMIHMESTHLAINCPYCYKPFDLHLWAMQDSFRDPAWRDEQLQIELKLMWNHLQQHLIVADSYSCDKCLACFLSPEDLMDHSIYHEQMFVNKKDMRMEVFNEEQRSQMEVYKKNHPIIQLKIPKCIPEKINSRFNGEGSKAKSNLIRDISNFLLKNEPNASHSFLEVPCDGMLFKNLMELKISDYECIKMYKELLMHSLFNRYIYMQIHIINGEYFYKKLTLAVPSDDYHEITSMLMSVYPFYNHCLSTVRTLMFLENYTLFCLSCYCRILDLTHYTTRKMACADVCSFESYCPKAITVHQEAVAKRPINHYESLIVSEWADNINVTKVQPYMIHKARLFDPGYMVRNEMHEISNEFPKELCPFFLFVCVQCCCRFKNFATAVLHVMAICPTKCSEKISTVLGALQSHIINRRSLVRVFRHEYEYIQRKIDTAYLVELIEYRRHIETLFQPPIKLKKKKTFHKELYLGDTDENEYYEDSEEDPYIEVSHNVKKTKSHHRKASRG